MSLKYLLACLLLSLSPTIGLTSGADAMTARVPSMAIASTSSAPSPSSTIVLLSPSHTQTNPVGGSTSAIIANANNFNGMKVKSGGLTAPIAAMFHGWMAAARALAVSFLSQLAAILPVLWTPFRIAVMLILLFAYSAYYHYRFRREVLEREQKNAAPAAEFGPEGDGEVTRPSEG